MYQIQIGMADKLTKPGKQYDDAQLCKAVNAVGCYLLMCFWSSSA